MAGQKYSELERLRALADQNVLDTLPEKALDDLVKLASFVFGAPISLISLIDENRQWFKARIGLGASETPREMAFCAHAIEDPSHVLIVEDATKDSRFAHNPLVTGDPNIRFYAGAPLVTKEGFALGTLCVIDRVPRRLSAEQIHALETLRDQVIREFQLRTTTAELHSAVTILEEANSSARQHSRALNTTVGEQKLELANRTREIVEQAVSLRRVNAQLMVAQDVERKRIARELHDSAGQLLAATTMTLATAEQSSADRPSTLAALAESQGFLRQLTTEIRTMSYLLHPPLLDELGLHAALEPYVQGLSERSKIQVTLDVPPDFPRLPEDVELMAFRVIQECLTNVLRHSGSATARIRLRKTPTEFHLSVADDGHGMSPERVAKANSASAGMGTQGMRERVRHFGGTIDIHSSPSGTRVECCIPV